MSEIQIFEKERMWRSSFREIILKELLTKITKDKPRKVCKQCHEIGHNTTSVKCKVNIEIKNKWKEKIKSYILSQNSLDEKSLEDYCKDISSILNISPNLCKTLYKEIPPTELLHRTMEVEVYLKELMERTKSNCFECNRPILCIQANTHRIWKGNTVCDSCWARHGTERDELWRQIELYRHMQCAICSRVQQCSEERFHYDHINMFNKESNIFVMINEGKDLKEIHCEIDKCQILCLTCHHIITEIERKIGFTRIKIILSRRFTQGEMSEEEYNQQKNHFQSLYEEKFKDIYNKVKYFFQNNSPFENIL